jgi:hypothetical protein
LSQLILSINDRLARADDPDARAALIQRLQDALTAAEDAGR